MAATLQQSLQQALNNYGLILVQVTQLVEGTPTQAAVDAIIADTTRLGVLLPKPTYSLDGENYDWAGYQTFIVSQMHALMVAIQRAGGPFTNISRARS